MNQDELLINGELLRLRREARGWVLADMATRACMSVKQIRQLEEGGISAFYSMAVKATAARKVGALLGLSSDEVFGQASQVVDTRHDDDEVHEDVSASPVVDASVLHSASNITSQDEEQVAQPVVENSQPIQPEQEKSKTSIGVIAGLFAAALALAAYMQPKEDPVTEAPPPLQVVPADAASAADAAASTASAEESTGAAVSQKPASSISMPVSAAVTSASSVSSAAKAP